MTSGYEFSSASDDGDWRIWKGRDCGPCLLDAEIFPSLDLYLVMKKTLSIIACDIAANHPNI